ncbi:MAG: hypothetical protein ACREEY_01730 [Brevundimonas sp.]
MSNFRFQEYTTSGAFNLSLSRTQVAALHRIATGGDHYGCTATAALERKGLIEALAAPEDYSPDRREFRATAAGLLCATLLAEAGLTQGPRDAMAQEIAALQAEVEDRRAEAHTARTAARSALARLDQAELDLTNERARSVGGKLRVPMTRRDPIPEVSRSELDLMVKP